MVTRSVVSSLAVATLVNLPRSRQIAHEAALTTAGHATQAVAQQALALAYQDVYVVAGVVAVAVIFLPLLLRLRQSSATADVIPVATTAAAQPVAAALPAR